MEVATQVGIVVAFVAVIAAFVMEGGNPVSFLSPPAMLLVFGGTLGACLASNRMPDLRGIAKAAVHALKPGRKVDDARTVNELMQYADVARREGLLALEEQARQVDDPFLRRALELVIDGTDSEEVALSLELEVDAARGRHRVAAKFFSDMGAFSPTLGIIGTVLGLVHALEGLADPKGLGVAISHAFIATLWGVMSANLLWLPIANKMRRLDGVETAHRELVIQGVLAIQGGASGRVVAERLKSHLPPRQRDEVGPKAAERAA